MQENDFDSTERNIMARGVGMVRGRIMTDIAEAAENGQVDRIISLTAELVRANTIIAKLVPLNQTGKVG